MSAADEAFVEWWNTNTHSDVAPKIEIFRAGYRRALEDAAAEAQAKWDEWAQKEPDDFEDHRRWWFARFGSEPYPIISVKALRARAAAADPRETKD